MIEKLQGTRSHHLSGTPHWKKKLKLKAFFARPLLVNWIQLLPLTAQDGKDGKGLKLKKNWPPFSSLHAIRKPKKILGAYFHDKINIPLIFSNRPLGNVTAFETSSKFSFSNRNDLKTCPFIFHPLNWMFLIPVLESNRLSLISLFFSYSYLSWKIASNLKSCFRWSQR